MKKHFESGLAFFVVAALCALAGLLQMRGDGESSGLVMFSAAGVWFIIGVAVRRKAKNAGGQ